MPQDVPAALNPRLLIDGSRTASRASKGTPGLHATDVRARSSADELVIGASHEEPEFVSVAAFDARAVGREVRCNAVRRREGIVAAHALALNGPLRGRAIRFDQVDELRVTDDVAVLHGHCVRERLPDAPTGGLPDGRWVLVFVAGRDADG